MRLVLKDFQDEYVGQLLEEIRAAKGDANRRPQAVTLSAPTGSGKTVMMAAAMERLIDGDDVAPPNPAAVFLWITDQPELNEQTRRRLLSYSTTFSPMHIEVIDTNFDQIALSPGRLYFLNTQKLGKDKTLVTPSDKRTYTIWETFGRTAQERGADFIVIVDEAHRGMDLDPKAQGEALSIVQKFIVGSPGEIEAVPIIVGVTATPKRFNELLEQTTRVTRRVAVAPDDVRASGLIKDAVRYHVPSERQPADITLLREAARSLRQFENEWESYCRSANEPLIRPLLIVQVEDATAGRTSRTDIAEALSALTEELMPVSPDAFAHSFQEAGDLTVGGRSIRHIAPSQIEADPRVRVVFFKTSLNTGWDCPRAEVMMSFRRAVDATLIAQLVGRMVRTPLARRIEGSESLNRVMLFLPHYNKAGLQNVVKYLTSDDGVMPPTEVEDASEVATLSALPASADLFKRVEQLPSYTIPRRRSVHDVHRLMRLARLLEDAGLRDGARDLAQGSLIDVLRSEVKDRETDEAFQQALSEEGRIAVDVVTEYHKQRRDENTVYVTASVENVRDLTDAIGRRMREGLHLAFVRTRVESDGVGVQDARLELAALYRDGGAHDKVMRRARELTTEWFGALAPTFSSLSPALQARLNEIRASSAQAERQPVIMPPTMTVTTVAAMKELAIGGHLYVDVDGHFPGKLTTWEVAVIREEAKRAGAMGWLRNLPRKPWSLAVPYQSQGNVAPLYPDLLFFRKISGGIVVDLLDPHLTALDDAAPKAQGLAHYADEHGALFGRIELIQVKDKQVQRLDLTKPAAREKVKAVNTNDHLRHLYDLLGES